MKLIITVIGALFIFACGCVIVWAANSHLYNIVLNVITD